MHEETRKYINALAQRVIKAYHLQIPISDIENVVTTLGGTVEAKANDFFYDGTIQKRSNDSFAIITAPFLEEQRKKFVIAQQLGHLFLHMGFKTDPICWSAQIANINRNFHTAEQVYQANEFAFALLMPEEAYRKVADASTCGSCVNTSQIASHFQVLTSTVIYRGRSIGYLA